MAGTIVKLCGNKSKEDLIHSAQSSATHLGFIFVPGTKRYVNATSLKEWISDIRPNQKIVGVFVEPPLHFIDYVLEHVPLDVIQLHGNETVPYILNVKETFQLPIWKAIHHGEEGLSHMRLFSGVVDGYVVDSKVKGAYGGTGVTFDWEAIPDYKKESERQGVSCLIAGGIQPNNVRNILAYQPQGIDLSSGIETNDQKDPIKIEALMREVEQYDTSISRC